MVAPIALYPDALVAQILAASAYPDQVAIADYWLGQNKSLSSTDLASAVNQQTWDPSVKALCQFPSVLDNLAHNLAWTSSLGQAFENQQDDVMNAVQAMRAKAQAAGNLQSNQQISVVQQTPQTIIIKPANPQVVYVPEYNPTVVYGSPYVVPLYTPPPVAVAVAAGIGFGAGIAIGAAVGGGGFVGGGVAFGGGWGGFGWGFNTWNCGWAAAAEATPTSTIRSFTTTTPTSLETTGTTPTTITTIITRGVPARTATAHMARTRMARMATSPTAAVTETAG